LDIYCCIVYIVYRGNVLNQEDLYVADM